MVDFSFYFGLELTKEQKLELEEIKQMAKIDNGKAICFFDSNNNISGYIIPKDKVDMVNHYLDSRPKKNSKIKRPKFNPIASKDKIFSED